MTPHNRETLLALIERAKMHVMSPEEIFEQRVSFVFGQQDYDNGDRFTKAEIRERLIEMMGRPACPRCATLDPTGEKSYEWQRPSVVYRPTLKADGTAWCALLGDDLQSGVAGFGDTPSAAMLAFDQAFWKERTPAANRAIAGRGEKA